MDHFWVFFPQKESNDKYVMMVTNRQAYLDPIILSAWTRQLKQTI